MTERGKVRFDPRYQLRAREINRDSFLRHFLQERFTGSVVEFKALVPCICCGPCVRFRGKFLRGHQGVRKTRVTGAAQKCPCKCSVARDSAALRHPEAERKVSRWESQRAGASKCGIRNIRRRRSRFKVQQVPDIPCSLLEPDV